MSTFKKNSLKAGSLTYKKVAFISFNESPLKMIKKNAFYFVLKVL